MPKYILPLLLIFLALGACRTTAIHPISTSVHASSDAAIERAIMAGCADRGWGARKIGPNVIEATLYRRTHFAAVTIRYNASGYQIAYKDSNNLKYNGHSIHRAYINWITYLDGSIRGHL